MNGLQKINWLNLLTVMMTVAGMVLLGVGISKHRAHAGDNAGTLLTIQSQVLLAQSNGWDKSSLVGNPNAPFSLVEFGDYQCPPCRALNAKMSAFLNKNRNSVNLRFRNLPLVDIHPHAMEAAIFAEQFRHTPVFWSVHNQLMQVDMNFPSIQMDLNRITKGSGVSTAFLAEQKTAALHAVTVDMRDADAMSLDSTPSLLLCCPDGSVYQVQDIWQVQRHIDKAFSWHL